MKLKFFTIPINSAEDFEKEVNAFLSTHKIVETEKRLIQSAGQAYWCIYIGYIEQGKTVYSKSTGDPIDYMKILPEKERIKYGQLRTVRKEIAKEDAVSAFVVATNAELAEIAGQLRNPDWQRNLQSHRKNKIFFKTLQILFKIRHTQIFRQHLAYNTYAKTRNYFQGPHVVVYFSSNN
jgi:hypothetical protein